MKLKSLHCNLNATVIEEVRHLAEYGAALGCVAPAVGASTPPLVSGFLTQKMAT